MESSLKLGKLAPRYDSRTLMFASYQLPSLPPAPVAMQWDAKVASWPMMKNDRIGDCTCAAAGHMIQCWSANASSEIVLPDADIIAAYSAITGYNPKTGKNDTGAAELDVLNFWRKHGIGGHQLSAYVALDPTKHEHIKLATYLFGGCYIGLALPLSARKQKVWTVTKGSNAVPGSWGGHAVPVVSYDASGITVVTWGALKTMTWAFWQKYCDEAYAILSNEWMESTQVSPSGFDLVALQADLQQVTK